MLPKFVPVLYVTLKAWLHSESIKTSVTNSSTVYDEVFVIRAHVPWFKISLFMEQFTSSSLCIFICISVLFGYGPNWIEPVFVALELLPWLSETV